MCRHGLPDVTRWTMAGVHLYRMWTAHISFTKAILSLSAVQGYNQQAQLALHDHHHGMELALVFVFKEHHKKEDFKGRLGPSSKLCERKNL